MALLAILLSVLAVLVVLIASELWWRRNLVHGEFSRKFVHITVGSFVAFWPYYLSPLSIKVLSVAFIVAVVTSQSLNIFKAIHSVQRPTAGELMFAFAVCFLAFAEHHPHIYTAALLMMSLADGFAAVIGVRFGKRNQYRVFGSPKSIAGTLTFFMLALLILIGYRLTTNDHLAWILVPEIALGATLLENLAIRGLDNLVVPLFVAAILYFYP